MLDGAVCFEGHSSSSVDWPSFPGVVCGGS